MYHDDDGMPLTSRQRLPHCAERPGSRVL